MRIRPATIADSAAIGHIQLASWRTMFPDAGIESEQYLAEFSDEERTEDWRELLAAPGEQIVYVAENEAGEVVGFALGAPDHIAARYQCELSAIHVLPGYRGQGIGKRLFAAVANQFKAQGCSSLWLWVLKGNLRARRLYERLGGQFVTEKRSMVGKNEVGIEIAETAYGWLDIDDLIGRLST
jgi:ribosomal protein S18 acetylase RimI-like enzyme